ncbi:MAG: SnoaL-like domain-containing protein [Fimbriimonas sp.]
MSNRTHVSELVEMVQSGKILEAFERFYAEDVQMRENTNAPTIGKAANRQREIDFLSVVREVHENRATFSVVEGDKAVIGWVLEFTNTDGVRLRLDQIAVQTWRDGQIVDERFVYDSAGVAVENREAVLA